MMGRIKLAGLAAVATLAISGGLAGGAQANILSLLPGTCGNQPASQPFAQWQDNSSYTLVPGGSFESGSVPWVLSGGATVQSGNNSLTAGSRSLSLPSGSTATSPADCTSIYNPTARLFVQNTGNTASHLSVYALYPGLLGWVQSAKIGSLTNTGSWAPSPQLSLGGVNLMATLSLAQTVVAFQFKPADSLGKWRIDDVYLDPFCKR